MCKLYYLSTTTVVLSFRIQVLMCKSALTNKTSIKYVNYISPKERSDENKTKYTFENNYRHYRVKYTF